MLFQLLNCQKIFFVQLSATCVMCSVYSYMCGNGNYVLLFMVLTPHELAFEFELGQRFNCYRVPTISMCLYLFFFNLNCGVT